MAKSRPTNLLLLDQIPSRLDFALRTILEAQGHANNVSKSDSQLGGGRDRLRQEDIEELGQNFSELPMSISALRYKLSLT